MPHQKLNWSETIRVLWHNSGACCQSWKRKKKKKPRTIDTVFVPSKPARYRHKYVKCCVDEYFEHYTFGTASNSKYIQKDKKKI